MNKIALTVLWSVAAIAVIVAMVATLEILTPHAALLLWGGLFAVVGVTGYFTAQRGRWYLFVILNVVVIAAVSHWIASSEGDSSAPTNFSLIFLAVYGPVHAAAMVVVGSLYWTFRGR